MHMKGGLIVHPDYNTPAPSWAQIWQAAFAEFKRWIVDESNGELCGACYRCEWEQTTYGERVTWRAQRLAGVTSDVDGAAFAVFHADLKIGRSGRAYYQINGKLTQHRHGGSESTWKAPQTFEPPTYTPEQRAEMERQAREQAELDRQRHERDAADRLKVFQEDLIAYYYDTLPLVEAPGDGEGVAYLRLKRVPLELLPDVRAARTARPTPTGYIFRRGERPLAPYIRPGALVVPLYDVRDLDSPIVAFQWIMDELTDEHGHQRLRPNGKFKRFRENAKPKTFFPIVHWIGDPRGAAVVAMAEGLATAATFYQLTGVPTGSTCDAGQLEETAKAWLEVNPRGRLIVAADDDFFKRHEEGKADNGGAGEAHATQIQKAGGSRVKRLPPPFRRDAMLKHYIDGSDWNDYYRRLLQAYGAAEGEKIARSEARALVAMALKDWNIKE